MKRGEAPEASASAGAARRRSRSGRLGLVVMAVMSASALLAATAQASTITVGSVLPLEFTPESFGQVKTVFNTTLPEKGANLVSPVNGAIVRWRVQGAKGGPFLLRVLHPTGTGAYQAVGASAAATPTGTGLQTFTANVPIHAGDLIGVDPSNASDEIGVSAVAGASYAFIFPPPLLGATVAPSGTQSGEEIELSAEVQPAPAITSVSPRSGSIAGGDTVTITGENLTSASAVKFGTTPAAGFAVESETQITATTPKTTVPGTVDVTVTTPAGTSPAGRLDRFTYIACVVPKLKGKTLKAARKALRGANCTLGKVKGRRGKVVKQRPKPGKVLPQEAKVSIKLRG